MDSKNQKVGFQKFTKNIFRSFFRNLHEKSLKRGNTEIFEASPSLSKKHPPPGFRFLPKEGFPPNGRNILDPVTSYPSRQEKIRYEKTLVHSKVPHVRPFAYKICGYRCVLTQYISFHSIRSADLLFLKFSIFWDLKCSTLLQHLIHLNNTFFFK